MSEGEEVYKSSFKMLFLVIISEKWWRMIKINKDRRIKKNDKDWRNIESDEGL